MALIAATPPTLVAIGAVVLGYLNRRQGQAIAAKAQTIEVKVDGKMEELLNLTRATARAAGVVEGRELAAVEKQARVAESERVEDRQAVIVADIHKREAGS